jgi:hypothetical protein
MQAVSENNKPTHALLAYHPVRSGDRLGRSRRVLWWWRRILRQVGLRQLGRKGLRLQRLGRHDRDIGHLSLLVAVKECPPGGGHSDNTKDTT